jgi:hypothetical protein
MVKNPEGFFNTHGRCQGFIHFVSGLKTYSVDQFFDEFYRPRPPTENFSKPIHGIQKHPGSLKNSPPPTVKLAGNPLGKRQGRGVREDR